MAPDLSIVVVSWNTRDDLRACLAAVPAACGALSHEIVVVDNASRDGTPAMVRAEFPGAALIETGANLGFAAGNNRALPACSGRILVLLNPDTVAEPGSLARLAAFLDATPQAGACGPLLTDADGRPTLSWGTGPRLRYHLLNIVDPARRWLPGPLRAATAARPGPDGGPPLRVGYVVGACLAAPRRVWAAVGPLDERFFLYFEETDWCRRAAAQGLEIWCVPEARVAHLEGRAAARVSRFSLTQFQASLRLFVAKHQGPAWVGAYRAAQFVEYGLKALLRGLASRLKTGEGRARDATLASDHWFTARLQLRSRLEPPPPA
ncbi:MAG TPA: glycosyltransferase family 2 protein [Candidatus Krumholzibacteria bacterium]|nr:glycosyltransferase family 2 protein [Candidatus Krumholzibacteria bacterium]